MFSKFRKYNIIAVIYVILFGGSAIVGSWLIIHNIYLLASGSYKVVPDNLQRIELIAKDNNARINYASQDKKGVHVIYKSDRDQYFGISGERFASITDYSTCFDLLSKMGMPFSVFTDKKGFDNYVSGRQAADIEVYQVIIRNRAFVNILRANELARKNKTWTSVMYLIFTGLCFYYCLRFRKHIFKTDKSKAKIINL